MEFKISWAGKKLIQLTPVISGIKKIIFSVLLILTACISTAASDLPDKLKVYIDCRNTHCDTRFILTEINVVDFLLDRTGADVQVLITSQPTGTGAKYQLIFYGLNRFLSNTDSLTFNVDGSSTDYEVRNIMIRYLKAGLAPFIAKTDQINNVEINMKAEITEADSNKTRKERKDPWNFWVFRIGGRARIEADKVYKTISLNSNLSARHVTDKLKAVFYLGGGTENSTYDYDTDSGPLNVIVNNRNFNVGHVMAKSIDSHWCYGYEVNFMNST
ncbi:MAG TPA: hypothetical protein VI583_11095, partial [Cyclobacteriaceae bacterium]|nr:hypothetical protein [Cyclobacteriaceae bacterium]